GLGGGEWMVGTRDHGLFKYDGREFRRLPTDIDDDLATYRLYHGTAISEKLVGLATLEGGLFVVDHDGNVIDRLAVGSGLPDNVVNFVYADRDGRAWLAMNNGGIVTADVASALTVFDSDQGLSGTIYDVALDEERTLVASGAGA